MALAPLLGSQLTGPRCILALSGTPIAWCSGIQISDNTQHDEMRTLGSLEVVEYVPVSYGATLSISSFALVTENFYTLGIAPQMGQNAQEHLLNLLAKGVQTGTLSDAKTNKMLYQLFGIKHGGSSQSPSPNSLVMSDVQLYVSRVVPFGATA